MITKIYYFVIACMVCCVSACDNMVDYNENYTPANQMANTGAPVIEAVYDVADTAFSASLSQGEINQIVRIVGRNLNQVSSIRFNTVVADLDEVYTASTKAVVRIPSELSMAHVNQIEYTTDQGAATYAFVVPFPTLRVEALQCEFVNAGEQAVVMGENFDIYQFGAASKVCIGDTELEVSDVTSTTMKVLIPAGTPDNSVLTFKWENSEGDAMQAELPFRPTQHLLYGDMSDISMGKDGPVQVNIGDYQGLSSLYISGSYDAWSWNTIDISRNVIDGLHVDDVKNYALKFEVANSTNYPLSENTGLQFCFNWGSSYAWNPGNGAGINTFGQWQTVTLPLEYMATKGIPAAGQWMTFRIVFQPHVQYDADFQMATSATFMTAFPSPFF